MEKIYLSDSGPKVSPAIYGFYRWNKINKPAEKMEQIVNHCLELGINTFDHADVYGDYQCEELFGKLMSKKSFKREDIVLFTKCGLMLPGKGRKDIRVKHYNLSKDHIIKSLENSLRKLKTDYVDVFLLDHMDPLANLEETAITLKKLQESGKVKNIGVVNFTVFQHQLLASYLRVPIVTNHIELSLLNTDALENGQLDYIKQRYMRPLASSPLAGGRIANGKDSLAERVRKQLKKTAKKYNVNPESIAIAWLLKLGALPLIGTTSEQRITNIANAFTISLDNQDWYELYGAARKNL